MQTSEFVGRVQHRVEQPVEQARVEAAVAAVLQVLGQTLSVQEAHDLAAQLPDPLKAAVTREAGTEAPADMAAFRDRVADVANLSGTQAHAYADATLSVLSEAVSRGEVLDVVLTVPPFVSELMAQ